jgi:hypothetical protein
MLAAYARGDYRIGDVIEGINPVCAMFSRSSVPASKISAPSRATYN